MLERVAQEFAHVQLGDRRLEKRAQKTVAALSADPSGGAPSVLSPEELEGFYRFVNNDSVKFDALLRAHADATWTRVAGLERVVIAHDTTDFRFTDEVPRAGLGPMDNGGQGFYAHFSLAVAPGRHALGVVRVEEWTRATRTSAKRPQKQRYEDPAKESLRWMRAVAETESSGRDDVELIHVMDREADDYDILCGLVEGGHRFVVRASFDRRLVPDEGNASPRLKTFARALEVRCQRQADLSSRRRLRPAKQRKLYPPRDAREAMLAFSAQSVTLRRPDKSKAPRDELTLNLVHVWEPEPPEGCEPVEWFLYTSEPLQSEEAILEVVDHYRSRWVIEEFFKALKSGCAYEKRQHETKDALMNVLGIFIPIAWSLLCMRTLSRDKDSAERPAQEVFTDSQLQLLREESKGRLPLEPTIRDTVLLMARVFGGHQPSNGEPGWQVLARAYEKLLTMEAGWRRAIAWLEKSSPRCDR